MMAKHKYIYLSEKKNEKGEIWAHVHILVGYCPTNLKYFKKMAGELRETFPQALEDDIECGKIYSDKSNFVKGNTIVCWKGYIEHKEYSDWLITAKQFNYYW